MTSKCVLAALTSLLSMREPFAPAPSAVKATNRRPQNRGNGYQSNEVSECRFTRPAFATPVPDRHLQERLVHPGPNSAAFPQSRRCQERFAVQCLYGPIVALAPTASSFVAVDAVLILEKVPASVGFWMLLPQRSTKLTAG